MPNILPHDHPANKYKVCTDCGVEYPPDKFPVHKHPQGYKGFISLPRCVGCHKTWKNKAHLARKYGLSIDNYEKLLEEQSYKCAICGSTGSGQDSDRFVVDHCHNSGRVRGLLCWPCNIGIGMFKERPDLIERVVRYMMDNIA
jgi:hypothetical protein